MSDEAAGKYGINRGALIVATLIVATLLLALVVAASTVGVASAASSKTVKGCIVIKTGKVRVISGWREEGQNPGPGLKRSRTPLGGSCGVYSLALRFRFRRKSWPGSPPKV